ncbi:hypothetical protein [Macrococcoides caseolyticum]|uniref:Uncharacterized protein n=1 Tax=Macrococcus caseolyticus (strain JCSC5402) TaxID=458233 RepID=B9EBQ4_MACCJ|nr:hypothetical protein [Macrococcus caseolyticus]BAH17665.1 hypothetical protein MCCL_0958 [Macrococcus caseolyticus JCSC5402]
MTDKEKYGLKLISIVFLSILVIFLISICVWIDIGNKNKDSVTIVFLTGLNVVIMSILTYLLLETSKKSNETNELLVKHTIHVHSASVIDKNVILITKLDNYLRSAKVIKQMVINKLSTPKKHKILKEIKSKRRRNGEDIIVFNNNELNRICKIKDLEVFLYYNCFPVDEPGLSIENLFFDSIFNTTKSHYRIVDARENWNFLLNLRNEQDLLLERLYSNHIQDFLNLSKKFVEEALNATDDNVNLIYTEIESRHADSVFELMNNIIYSLEEMIKNLYEVNDNHSKRLYFD